MLFATLAENTERAGPHGRRALAILDLGCLAGFSVLTFDPLLLLTHLFQTGTLWRIAIFIGYLAPLIVLAVLALRAFLKRDDLADGSAPISATHQSVYDAVDHSDHSRAETKVRG